MDPILQVIIAISCTFLFVTILFTALYFLCSRKPRKYQNDRDVISLPTPTTNHHTECSSSFDPSLYISMPVLKSACRDFSHHLVIGDGSFGLVYKAQLPNGVTVAVKKLSPDAFQGLREFAAEMDTLAKIRHLNLVRIVGYSISGHDRILVYDFVERGSLDQWLHEPTEERSPSNLSWSTRVQIIRGVANGLAYLHDGCNIIHRDIKSSNVLLDKEFVARIADFGLARKMESSWSHVSTVAAGTMGYMPPEYRDGSMLATVKGDVYSFGVLMLEVATGKRPNLTIRVVEKEDEGAIRKREMRLVNWVRWTAEEERWSEMLDPTIQEIDKEEEKIKGVEKYFKVAFMCLEDVPKKRPLMRDVLNLLNQL